MNKKVFVLTHLGLGDNILMIPAINYLSTKYDIVKVICKSMYKNDIKMIYSNKINIIVDDYEDDKNISPLLGFNIKEFEKIVEGYDILLCGLHINKSIKKFPSDMYEHLSLDFDIFNKYFSIPEIKESKYILDKVRLYTNKFIFVHEQSSYGGISFRKEYENIKDEILIINPDKNVYEVGHKYYDIAKYLIRLPILYYIDIFRNCKKMYIMDSCYFALICQLKLKIPIYVYVRMDYNIYDKEIFDNIIILNIN
jgi:hypothetical protein